jgi:NADH-quinone oxidoreductase subunit J
VLWVKRLGLDVTGGAAPLPPGYSNTQAVGAVLYTDYVYPFQLAAVVLLIAIVAAIALTMRRRPGLKVQDVGEAGRGAPRGSRPPGQGRLGQQP